MMRPQACTFFTSPRLRGEVARRSPQGEGVRVRGRFNSVSLRKRPLTRLAALLLATLSKLALASEASGQREHVIVAALAPRFASLHSAARQAGRGRRSAAP